VTSSDEPNAVRGVLSLVADFYVDFLGSLVPGLFAVVLMAAVLATSLSIVCHVVGAHLDATLTGRHSVVLPPLSSQLSGWRDVGFGPYGNIGLLLVFAFILGALFYRQDPKKPDFLSARRAWEYSLEEEEGLAARPLPSDGESANSTEGGVALSILARATARVRRTLGGHLGLLRRKLWARERPRALTRPLEPRDAEFPYHFLHEYLEHRGLTHLARLVPWRGKDPTTHNRRTKMFLNVLKVRLQFTVPERCKEIVRNEAHVRMSTSVWYAAGWVMLCAIAGLVMLAFSVKLATINHKLMLQPFTTIVKVGFLNVLVLVLAKLIQWQIERFLHYQRVREVVYVLETAYFARESRPDLHLADLCGMDEDDASPDVAAGLTAESGVGRSPTARGVRTGRDE